MPKILFLHGFASSGNSGTATILRDYLYKDYGVTVISPDIPIYPSEARTYLTSLVEAENPDLIFGTSMGGMYAELLKGYPRICVNPAFTMSKLITMKFKYLGKNVDFLNKRQDGTTSFKVDKQMIAEFKEIETTAALKNITPEEKKRVWGIFGKNDTVVNCQNEFTKAYGREQFKVIEGEHGVTQNMLKHDILPIIKSILKL